MSKIELTQQHLREARDSARIAQRIIEDGIADRKQDYYQVDEMTQRYFDACHEIEDLQEKLKLNEVKLNQLRYLFSTDMDPKMQVVAVLSILNEVKS